MKAALFLCLGAAAGLGVTQLTPSSPNYIQHLDAVGEFTYLGDLNPTYESMGWGEYWVNRAWHDNASSTTTASARTRRQRPSTT